MPAPLGIQAPPLHISAFNLILCKLYQIRCHSKEEDFKNRRSPLTTAMENDPVKEPQVEATLILLKKIWVFFLVGLYAICLYNEYRFPGVREGEPLDGEAILWNIERVIFFGLMGLGLLTDIMQIRVDRSKAFLYLFASLVLGGLCNLFAMGQMKVFRFILG
jgi:hypothetical protein